MVRAQPLRAPAARQAAPRRRPAAAAARAGRTRAWPAAAVAAAAPRQSLASPEAAVEAAGAGLRPAQLLAAAAAAAAVAAQPPAWALPLVCWHAAAAAAVAATALAELFWARSRSWAPRRRRHRACGRAGVLQRRRACTPGLPPAPNPAPAAMRQAPGQGLQAGSCCSAPGRAWAPGAAAPLCAAARCGARPARARAGGQQT